MRTCAPSRTWKLDRISHSTWCSLKIRYREQRNYKYTVFHQHAGIHMSEEESNGESLESKSESETMTNFQGTLLLLSLSFTCSFMMFFFPFVVSLKYDSEPYYTISMVSLTLCFLSILGLFVYYRKYRRFKKKLNDRIRETNITNRPES